MPDDHPPAASPAVSEVWPPPPTAGAPAPPLQPVVSYQSPQGLATAASILIALCVMTRIGLALAAHGVIPLIHAIPLLGGEKLFFLLGGIIFLIWTYRVHRNLYAFGAHSLPTTPGWAVAYFLLPILAWFRPYQNFAMAWRASDPALDSSRKGLWDCRPVPPWIGFWWLFWVLDEIVWNTQMDALLGRSYRGLGELFDFVAGLLAILFLRAMTARQEEKARRLFGFSA